jgi:hypothetical protein
MTIERCQNCIEKDKEIARLHGRIAGLFEQMHARTLAKRARKPRSFGKGITPERKP